MVTQSSPWTIVNRRKNPAKNFSPTVTVFLATRLLLESKDLDHSTTQKGTARLATPLQNCWFGRLLMNKIGRKKFPYYRFPSGFFHATRKVGLPHKHQFIVTILGLESSGGQVLEFYFLHCGFLILRYRIRSFSTPPELGITPEGVQWDPLLFGLWL